MSQEETYDFKSLDTKLQYQLLDRLRQDCDYFIRMKAENPEVKDCSRVLYYGDAQKQIEAMRELWNVIEEKPAWLTMEQIDVYAGKMGVELKQVESMGLQDEYAHSSIGRITNSIEIDRTEAQANLERWKSEYVEQFKNTEYYDFLNSMSVPNKYISGCGDLLPLRNREDFNRYFDAADELNSMHPAFCCKEDIEEQKSKVKTLALIFKTGLKKDLEEVINKNMVKKNSEDTAVQSKEKGSRLTQYMQSLQYPDDFLSGDMSLLPEENYDQYVKHIRAIQEYENLDPDDFFIDPTFPPEEQNYTFFEASQDSLSKVMQTGDEFVSQLKQSLSSLNLISIDNSIDNKVETSNYSVADSSKSKDGQKFADYMKSLELPNDLTSGNPALLPWQIRGLLEDYLRDEKEWGNTEYPEMSWHSYNAFRSSFKRVAFKELNTGFVNDMKIDLEKLKPSLSDTKSIRASIDAKLYKLSNRNILDVKLPLIFLANNGNKLYVSQIYETDRFDLIAKINGQTLKLDRLDYIPIQDKSVQEIIVKGFGEQLGLKEHYQQFVLPEVYGISHDDIRIECDLESNYQIIISRPSENIIAAPLSKNDADAIHNDIATIEQLAAKYLYNNRFTLVEQQIQQVMEPEATYGKTVKQSTKNNKNMAKKKTDNPLPEEKKEVKVKKESTSKKTVSEEVSTVKSEVAKDVKTDVVEKSAQKESISSETVSGEAPTVKSEENKDVKTDVVEKSAQKGKRQPQLVTPAGDAVSHAHWYTVDSGKLYFTAKLNGEPLKPQLMDPADAAAVEDKKVTMADLFAKYYPTKMLPKLSPDEFKFPRQIETSQGNFTVAKYNVYKEDSPNGREYRFYAQIGDKKMSAPASREDLNGYFDRTTSPKDQIIRSFGDRLKLPEHYAQFQLPTGFDIPDNQIRFKKGEDGKSYDITVSLGDNKLSEKMSYHDTSAFFDKTATRQQLAAKYFGDVLPTINVKTEQKQEAGKSMCIK